MKDTPIVFWNRNTDLPNKPEFVDPIVWWKMKNSKKRDENLSFFTSIAGVNEVLDT